MQLVERAIFYLDTSPDRGIAFLERDLELVHGSGERQPVRLGDRLVGCLEEEPQGATFIAGAGLLDGSLGRFLELLQLGYCEVDVPLVRLIQLEAVGETGS